MGVSHQRRRLSVFGDLRLLKRLRTRADNRFIEQSRSSINGRHKSLETSLGEDISSLQKKQKYYDRQVEEANGQLRDIVSNS